MIKITDDFGNILSLKTKNAEIFCDYVTKNYDLSIPEISGKLYHTLRVADMCIELAEKLGLDKELAYTIGLLHDFSRFEQWKKYQSFADHKTVDHADEAVRLLFDENQIVLFDVDEKEKELIRIAVKNHNKKEIDIDAIKQFECGDFDRILAFCKIIRDSDKYDIFYRMQMGDIGIDFEKTGVSPKVTAFYQIHEMVDKREVQTGADELLTLIGYLFDMNYTEMYQCMDMDAFWNGVDKFYCKNLNKEDNAVVQKQIEIMKNFISTKITENEKNN